MSIVSRLDRFQRKHPAAGFPLAVLYKFVDDSGAYLAALITYYAFVSLFPLLLLMSTVLGYVLSSDVELQKRILDSALGQFPVVGNQLDHPGHLGGGVVGIVIGVLGATYGGLGVAQASQYAMNTAWAVPRNKRPNPLKARGRSLLLLSTAGIGVITTTALSSISAGAASFGVFGRVLFMLASVVTNCAIFILGFRIATARKLTVHEVAPGALVAAIFWQILQSFGALYVGHVVRGASLTNAVFAFVLGLIAFLYIAAAVVVLCVEINVVRVDELHPRALLTPFTDDVTLTEGDRSAYSGQATAQRTKGFETIDVAFDEPEAQAHEPKQQGSEG